MVRRCRSGMRPDQPIPPFDPTPVTVTKPYTGKRLVPLKGYPGIVWERPKSRRRPRDVDDPEFLDRPRSRERALSVKFSQ